MDLVRAEVARSVDFTCDAANHCTQPLSAQPLSAVGTFDYPAIHKTGY